MKSFGKIVAVWLSACLLLAMPVAAMHQDEADILYELGLFRGTGQGYELENELTREQAVTILVRLLGEEGALDAQDYRAVFEDVDEERWSFPYVMYCYENGITKGTGKDSFSPEKSISAEEFITLVLRLMGYEKTEPETAFLESVYVGILNTEVVRNLKKAERFLRDDMVYITYRSLMSPMEDGVLLADFLAEKGVITDKEAFQFNVYENTDDIDVLIDSLLG